MSTQSISARGEHIRSVSVTAMTAFAGIAAAVASSIVTEGAESVNEAAWDRRAQAIMLGLVVAQILVVRFSPIYDEDEVGMKHYLFVLFMTFAFWFVTWGVMLTTGASF